MRPELLTSMREAGNDADPYSVAMISSSMTVVGHESMAEEGTLEDSASCRLAPPEYLISLLGFLTKWPNSKHLRINIIY